MNWKRDFITHRGLHYTMTSSYRHLKPEHWSKIYFKTFSIFNCVYLKNYWPIISQILIFRISDGARVTEYRLHVVLYILSYIYIVISSSRYPAYHRICHSDELCLVRWYAGYLHITYCYSSAKFDLRAILRLSRIFFISFCTFL